MSRIFGILFSLIFYPLLAVYTVFIVCILSLWVALGSPFVSHRESMRRFRLMIAVYAQGAVCVLARPVLRRIYEAPPRDRRTAKIFIMNHISASDAFLLSFLSEEIVQVVNKWPFKLPILGLFARWAGYLSIREMTTEEFQSRAEKLLADGVSILAFPEGTRAGTGPMGSFHGAMFRVALRSRAPIVPLCIMGNERLPARGSLVLEPSTVRIHGLPEIHWESYRGQSSFQLKNQVRGLIQTEVNRMRGVA